MERRWLQTTDGVVVESQISQRLQSIEKLVGNVLDVVVNERKSFDVPARNEKSY